MASKKISIVANSYWNIFNFRMELIQHLIANGYEVSILAGKDQYVNEVRKVFPKNTHLLKCMKAGSQNVFYDLFLFFELLFYYIRLKPDVVLQYTIKANLYGSIAAILLGKKCISNLTGLGFAYGNGTLFKRIFIKYYRWILSFNDCIVFHNQDDLDWFGDSDTGFLKKAKVIPGSGVNPDYFYPADKARNMEVFRCVFAARLLKEKGIYEFIDACKMLLAKSSAFQFTVAGPIIEDHSDGILQEEIEGWVKQGWIDYIGKAEDIRTVLSQADVYVLPSYREGMPRTLLEAMSMEIPVIVTNVPGCKQAVEDGVNGFIVLKGSVQDLANAMERMKDLDIKRRQFMGIKGRALILEHYDTKKIIKHYMELLESI